VDTAADFSDVTTNYIVSIYEGTGKGQQRAITSITGTTQLNMLAWTTNPDSTSKYALRDTSKELNPWYKTNSVQFSQPEYADTLRFMTPMSGSEGMRLRLVYDSKPGVLSAEADVTTVNQEYVVAAACSILHGMAMADSRFDRDLHFGESVRHKERADIVLLTNRPKSSPISIWNDNSDAAAPSLNPMGWDG
jgi:hypothetical protein